MTPLFDLRRVTAKRFPKLALIGLALIAALPALADGPGDAPAKITASTGMTIKKMALVYKIDGEWGDTFWAGSFMHNSRMTLKLEKELAPGEHTLEIMYRLQPPVVLTFTAEAGKEYELVDHEGGLRLRGSDGSYVGTATPALWEPPPLVPGEASRLQQPQKAVAEGGEKFSLTVLKIDGRYGPFDDYPARYIFNDPDRKGEVLVDLPPGEHELEFYGSDGGSRTKPQTVRFTTEPGKAYELRLTFLELTDKEARKYFKGILIGKVVEKQK